MNINGKFGVDIKENGVIVKSLVSYNTIVNNGFAQVMNWLKHDLFTLNNYSCLKPIDVSGMVISNSGFSNDYMAVDSNSETYASVLNDSVNWDTKWWKIDFGENKNLMALYVDWTEDDVNYGGDYKFQYSVDNVNWVDFPTRLRPPQETVRGKITFFCNPAPPFSTLQARYVRLNIKRFNDSDNFYLYDLKFYESNFLPQPPLIMKLGTSDAAVEVTQNNLGAIAIAKKVEYVSVPSANVVRYSMFLDTTEGNGVDFKEAGMFYYSVDNFTVQTDLNVDKMFSRALYVPVWSKTSSQTADAWYEIELSNV